MLSAELKLRLPGWQWHVIMPDTRWRLPATDSGATVGKYMFEQTFRNIDDVLWKEADCTTELDYTEQTSWMLFLQ